jgi:hypothetical protein
MKQKRTRPPALVDRRTKLGKRRHQLVQQCSSALGHPPSVAEASLIERAVTLEMALAAAEATHGTPGGLNVDRNQKAASALRRILTSLLLVKGPADYTGVRWHHSEVRA